MKKYLMLLIWRISQTGPILSIFFWSAALSGIFWPIVGGSSPPGPLFAFLRWLGIPADRVTVVGLLLLFLVFAATILFIGFVYDRVLKLWREQMYIAMDRNPYADDLLFHKEIMQWEQYYLPLARAMYKVSPDPELKRAIERVERWVATGRIESTQK
ncbi:MAG: hypothetical protein E6K18_05735 [Methanobacteriota archaeon]|nr:MAG: hypothetical protein E6K18_05735 [Euryarchaeota archaeon]